MKRCQVRVRGLVQGVGFRPHVYILALDCKLTGWVRNDGMGVILEVQGERVDEFVRRLTAEKPPLSRIDSQESTEIPIITEENNFAIVQSEHTEVTTSIVPDAAVCNACLEELLTPGNRRSGYEFLNCTHCGPRYTITRSLPYDRPHTSMAPFPMCHPCELEYHDPLNRRFHAQPTACPDCGPQLSHSIEEVVAQLRAGKILAIKGLGGFHLACDGTQEASVQTLRQRKNREAKPFALMVANLVSARQLVEVSAAAEELLTSTQRPVVLCPRRNDGRPLALGVAPGMRDLGIMLPYTPLHHKMFHVAAECPPYAHWNECVVPFFLVMTSANPGGEPLVINNDEARLRLAKIADTIVDHNREILIRVDDSVMHIVNGVPAFLRRARSYVPQSVRLSNKGPAIIAIGSDLKNTCCVTRAEEAFVSQHVGDLDNAATFQFLQDTAAHLTNILQVKPEAVACDLHPDFLSTHMAHSLGIPVIPVQHHHAHIAAVLAEYGVQEPTLGLALDGLGLGTDNTIWGGELLLVDGPRFERLGHLAHLKQPGGDRAAREPWRMAAAALHALGRDHLIEERFSHTHPAASSFNLVLEHNSPITSSCGRLFDAAGGLLGLNPVADFEGQAPMLLESMVRTPACLAGGFELTTDGNLSLLPLLEHFIDTPSMTIQRGADLFHGTLIVALVEWCIKAVRRHSIPRVALAGGCFLNRILAEGVTKGLREAGVTVLYPHVLPPNDGAISLGQAWVALQQI